MQLLLGTPLAQKIKKKLIKKKSDFFPNKDAYIAILFFWENTASEIYVKLKKNYAEEIGLRCKIMREYSPNLIDMLNKDIDCVGIMIQLPLPEHLKGKRNILCNSILPSKDIDGLWQKSLVLPATVRAVLELRNAYKTEELTKKKVVVIGQSQLIGIPLAQECKKQKAEVKTFDIRNTPEEIAKACKEAEIIFSCTGDLHFFNQNFIKKDKSQIIFDIGFWHIQGKATGDVDFEKVQWYVKAITPVPWGVGPLTVASIFLNLFDLQHDTTS